MTNSKLISYTRLSPNCNARPSGAKISKIAIHYMAGNLSIESCGAVFAPESRQASSNYGIGSDGRIGMYVEEKNRAWTTGSAECDNVAVTIEVANTENTHGTVTDKALDSLIKLCTDICKRNGITKCTYTGDKSGTLQMHKWYQATSCPGEYLASKFSYIAEQVNKGLGVNSEKVTVRTACHLSKEAYNGSGYVAALPKDCKVTFLQDDGYGWAQCSYEGKTGWTYCSHLNKSGLSGFPVKTCSKKTCLRKKASTSSKNLITLPQGAKVTVKSIRSDGWSYCKYKNVNGWVRPGRLN